MRLHQIRDVHTMDESENAADRQSTDSKPEISFYTCGIVCTFSKQDFPRVMDVLRGRHD